jgi:hypothetical protein
MTDIAAKTNNPAANLSKSQASMEDYRNAAKIIDCDPIVLRTVCLVESNGYGFDRSGFPTILVEPHIIWKHATFNQRRILAPLGLAYPKWGMRPYGTYFAQHGRFETVAAKAGLELAILGTSFGLTQILGENYGECGFMTAYSFYAAMCASEGAQIDATAYLLLAMGLSKALREKAWATVARGWNGPAYAKNHYDAKLSSAYATLQKRSWVPEQTRLVSPTIPAPTMTSISYPTIAEDQPGEARVTPPRGYEVESIGWIDLARARIGV